MKNTKVTCKDTSEFWGTIEGRVGIVTKDYFYNGETHFKGIWEDTKEKFDLPTVFFNWED